MGSVGQGLVPNYEVKLLMDASKVLDSDNKLKDSVRKAFDIDGETIKMSIQFLDTPEEVFNNGGWNLRIRKSEDKKKKLGLTYKRRIPIRLENHDPKVNINTAVTQAQQEGFDAPLYESQVEVGFTKQTLSVGHDETVKTDDGSMDLPGAKESRKMLTENAPAIFNSWFLSAKTGAGGPLDSAIVYGPIKAKRYVGKWNGDKLYIEVWPIRTSKEDGTMIQVVEASFKVDETTDAMDRKAELQKVLEGKGWFEAKDSLKTALIMANYPPADKK